MKLGIHLYELWRLRVGLVVAVVLATMVSLATAYRVSIAPPGLHPRMMGMAAASTHVLVDNPKSVLLDLGQGASQLQDISQRALLLGNVMASLPVREYVARSSGVPAGLIQVTSPLTPQYPRPIADDPQNQRAVTDLLSSNDQYRINIKANPTVPILDIYTEASTVKTAKALANGAVSGLREYLAGVSLNGGIPAGSQVRLVQLGAAQGSGVTGAVNVEVAVLAWMFTFMLASLANLMIARMTRGWRLSQEVERLLARHPTAAGNGAPAGRA